MARITKKATSQLERLKGNVKNAHEYFMPNYRRYHRIKKFVMETALTSADLAVLQELGKPPLEFNTLEAYISRLRGEFAKQEPNYNVMATEGAPKDDSVIQTIQTVEGHLRYITSQANNDSFALDIYTDLLTGGFSVGKVWTEYAHEMSFDQVIRNGRVYDPTLCGFDPMARLSHKGDGEYAFENYPKTVQEFENAYPGVKLDKIKFSRNLAGFNWSYRNAKEEILIMSDYFEKVRVPEKIVQLTNGQIMTVDEYEQFLAMWDLMGQIEQPPQVRGKSRKTEIVTIDQYILIENQILEHKKTDYKKLPLVFFDGNSVLIRDGECGAVQQITRPYVYHALGMQRLKNFAGQTLANELENMIMHKYKVAKESIPEDYIDAYQNIQKAANLVYNAFKDNDPNVPVPPPQEIARVPMPPEVSQAFLMGDQTMQAILGSYDASLGINNNQLSGTAIQEGATQSNAAAMPYVNGFMAGLNQMGQINLDLIPKYYVTPRTIPVMRKDGNRDYAMINQQNGVNMQYPPHALEVRVEAGVNFTIQKSRALQQIIGLMQASQAFGAFMNQEGLEVLLDNLEIRGNDQLQAMAAKWMQQMRQQAQQAQNQPNPEAIKAQLEQAKMAANQQQKEVENQLRAAEIANTAEQNRLDEIKLQQQAQQAQMNAVTQQSKAQAQMYRDAIKSALEIVDQDHQHAKDKAALAHEIIATHTKQSKGERPNA